MKTQTHEKFFLILIFDINFWNCPPESTKKGRKSANGLNCKIFLKSTVIFNNFEFLPLNHLRHFGIFDLLRFVLAIQFFFLTG